MKKPSRFLRVLGAAGLLISLLAATVAPVAAQDEGASQDFLDYLVGVENAGFLTGDNAIFYPWVANGENFGLGPSETSISVQNLEDRDTVISIFVGNGSGGFDLVTSAYLSAYAAKTFSAAALGIAEGEGAPVMVTSFNETPISGFPAPAGVPAEAVEGLPGNTAALVETPVILSNPVADDTDDGENDGGTFTQVVACVVNYHTTAQPLLGNPWGYVAAVDHTFAGDGETYEAGDWVPGPFTQQELQDTLNDANEGNEGELINPFGGLNNDGDCFDVVESADGDGGALLDSVAIGGVAKQTAEAAAPGDDDENGDENGDDEGAELEQFTTTDTSVSGYNAVNGIEIAYFDEWYLPIVQTNCGPGGCWDSMLRVANLDSENNAVTVRFFPADDGSGSLQTGFQLQALIDGGDTWHINLGDYVPDEWVGSAHIFSDGAVFAMVDRYKVGYNMWITNTGSSADFENLAQVPGSNGRFALFAPHVLMDYFGWNTGINVANLVPTDNNISIQYFNMLGNATEVLNQRLAAHGMTYFYDPSVAAQDNNSQDVTTDPNAGVVGSAIIWSDFPVAAAVDATKYPETDPNGGADVGHATSYSATANVFPWQAVPYVTKGNPIDGSGATSGINIMNPNSVAATANVYYVNPSGFNAQNFGTSSVTIPAFANGFVYTLWQNNLPNGFLGAAQVVANVPVAAVSANVNYDVEGDGSAIFNAFNPCGLYRVAAACSFGDVFEPGGQSVTKTFVDEFGDPVAGVNFSIASTSGAGYQRDAVSGVDGSAILTNVPVGVYELEVNDVPAGYVLPEGVQETFAVTEGEDVVLENVLEFDQGVTKFVCLAEEVNGPVPAQVPDACGEPVVGVEVTISFDGGTDINGDPVAGDEVFSGETGEDGSVSTTLPAGESFLLCISADGDETVGGEPIALTIDEPCETFTLVGGESLTIVNIVEEIPDGIIAFVGELLLVDASSLASHADTLTPVAGVEVCIEGLDVDFEEACETSGEDGNIFFAEAPSGEYEVVGWTFPEGYFFVCVEGSAALEWSENAIECDELNSLSTSLLGQQGFTFTYDASLSVAGVYDATLELEQLEP